MYLSLTNAILSLTGKHFVDENHAEPLHWNLLRGTMDDTKR